MDMKTSNMQIYIHEPMFSKRFKLTCAPIKDSDEHAHPYSLIKVSDRQYIDSQGSNVASGGKLRLKSDCRDAQTDLNLRCMAKPTCKYAN